MSNPNWTKKVDHRLDKLESEQELIRHEHGVLLVLLEGIKNLTDLEQKELAVISGVNKELLASAEIQTQRLDAIEKLTNSSLDIIQKYLKDEQDNDEVPEDQSSSP